MKHIKEIANEFNKLVTEESKYLPIKYDGLMCPKCHAWTVCNGPYSWCPDIACDYGTEPVPPKLITKWCTKCIQH